MLKRILFVFFFFYSSCLAQFSSSKVYNYPLYLNPCLPSVEDLNCDGNLDYVVSGLIGLFGPAFKFYDGVNPANVISGPIISISTSYGLTQFADVNLDGFTDIIQPIYDPNVSIPSNIAVYYGLGNGHFSSQIMSPAPALFSFCHAKRIDYDLDGISDFVFGGSYVPNAAPVAFSGKWNNSTQQMSFLNYTSQMTSGNPSPSQVVGVPRKVTIDAVGYKWLVFGTNVFQFRLVEATQALNNPIIINSTYNINSYDVYDFDFDGNDDIIYCSEPGMCEIIYLDQYKSVISRNIINLGSGGTVSLRGLAVEDIGNNAAPQVCILDAYLNPAVLIITDFITVTNYTLSNQSNATSNAIRVEKSELKNGRNCFIISLFASSYNSEKLEFTNPGAYPSSTFVGSEPTLGWINRDPSIGDLEMSFVMSNGYSGMPAIVSFGSVLNNPPVALTPYFNLYNNLLFYSSATVVNSNGCAAVNWGIPWNPSLYGIHLACQWITSDLSSNAIGSNGIDLYLGYSY